MPFALHTCGVTTGTTLHTNSYRTRLPHHHSIFHDPHAFKKGEGCAAAADDFARQAATPLEKAPRRDFAPSGV